MPIKPISRSVAHFPCHTIVAFSQRYDKRNGIEGWTRHAELVSGNVFIGERQVRNTSEVVGACTSCVARKKLREQSVYVERWQILAPLLHIPETLDMDSEMRVFVIHLHCLGPHELVHAEEWMLNHIMTENLCLLRGCRAEMWRENGNRAFGEKQLQVDLMSQLQRKIHNGDIRLL